MVDSKEFRVGAANELVESTKPQFKNDKLINVDGVCAKKTDWTFDGK